MPITIKCEHDVNCYEAGKGLVKNPALKNSKDWACVGARGIINVPGPVDARDACTQSKQMAFIPKRK